MNPKSLTDAHIALQLFPGYTELDTVLFEQFLNPNAKPEPGFLTDFLGCRTRITSLWKEVRELDGQLLRIPVPGDFHAETIEWLGLLKAVRGANREYVAMELGAGFGPWVIAGGMAAKLRGIENIRLYAVEGDPQHFRSLHQHFIDNGFEPSRHTLIEAAVGITAGVAQWPVLEDALATEEWGLRPMQSNTDYTGRKFHKTKPVNVIAMRELVLKESFWDLIHIDVQGDEVDICRSCIDELNARARWIIVGTHSRKLDGDFLQMMCDAGWFLEHEKPAKFTFVPNSTKLESMTTMDGTQVWRNPRLTAFDRGTSLSSFSQEITCSIESFQTIAGTTYALTIQVKNTGLQAWFSGGGAPVNASYRWVDSQKNGLPIEGARSSLHRTVEPGQSDTLTLQVAAPLQTGSYTLLVSMVQEGVAWFVDRGAKPLIVKVEII